MFLTRFLLLKAGNKIQIQHKTGFLKQAPPSRPGRRTGGYNAAKTLNLPVKQKTKLPINPNKNWPYIF